MEEIKKLKEEIEKLKSNVYELAGEISELSLEIKQKVNTDDIIAAINLSPEGVRIKADKIHIGKETLIDDEIKND